MPPRLAGRPPAMHPPASRQPRRKRLRAPPQRVPELTPADILLRGNKGHRGHLLPISYDCGNMGLLHDATELPGSVPDSLVPPPADVPLLLPEATPISPEVWVGESYHYPHKGLSLWVRFKSGSQPPPGYAVLWYWGETTESLGLSFAEFSQRFATNDFLLGSAHHKFGVVGAPESPASYANDGFYHSNAFFWYVPEVRAYFLCLRGRARVGVAYELMPNYGDPGFPSLYWTPQRVAQLPRSTQVICRQFYPSSGANASARPASVHVNNYVDDLIDAPD